MKKLELEKMVILNGSGLLNLLSMSAHDRTTVLMCSSTFYLAFSPLAPLAAATGLACVAGLYSASMYD